MKILARVPLSLNKTIYNLSISYNTYEKPSYDEYLCCAISLLEKNTIEQNKYIDDITGKGSLNSHFKNVLEKTNKLSEDILKKSLRENLFPILKIYEYKNVIYFNDLKKIVIKDKIYSLDIKEINKEVITKIFNIGDIVDFKINLDNENSESDMYNVEMDDKNIYVELYSEKINIDIEIFRKLLQEQKNDMEKYEGKILNEITNNKYFYLNSSSYDEILEPDRLSFISKDGSKIWIKRDKLIQRKIFCINNIYFYTESNLEYAKQHRNYIIEAAAWILKNELFTIIETHLPLKIVSNIDDKNSFILTNIFLEKKHSSELAKYGLQLIKNNDKILNNEFKWSKKSLIKIKEICLDSDFNYIYKIDKNVGFNDIELSKIDDTILDEEDKKRKENYLSNLEKIKKEMNEMMGEINNSGIRESIKRVKSNNDTINFSKKYNKLGAHNKKDIDLMNEIQLKNRYNEIKELFNIYKKIKPLISK